MAGATYPRPMLVSRPGISRRMVGRLDALAELHKLVDDSQWAARPSVAMITGEAGIGKTRLLCELIAAVASRMPVVAGQAREGDAQRAFALTRDAVEERLDGVAELPDRLERWRHPLGHLLEPLLPFVDHRQDDHAHNPEELARAGVALIRTLVGEGPAVIAFEDLHWADAGSLEVFSRLARCDAALLLVGTFRPEDFERRHPLAELLAELERQGSVAHLSLQGLSRQDLAEMLEEAWGRPVGGAVIERLHRRTRGNPFFVEELFAEVEHCRTPSGIEIGGDPARLVDVPLPWSTSEAALRRLERFDDRTRLVLQTAAVLGDRFDVRVLAEVLDETLDVIDVLAPLVRAGVLVEHSSTVFAFRHALTWEAAASEPLESEKREIHAHAFSVMARDDSAPHAALAHHALSAGHTREAVEHARTAAHRALHTGAPREALRLAHLVLEHAPEDARTQELAAFAAAQLGEFEQASVHAERWVALARATGDRHGQALGGCHLAWTRWWAGAREQAWAALRAAVAVGDGLEASPARARVLANHSRFLMADGRPTEAVDKADEAIEAAEEVDDPGTRAKAWLHKSGAILDSLDHQRHDILEQAANLIDRACEESARLEDVETLAGALHNRLVPDQPDDVPMTRSLELLAEAKTTADRYGLERLADKLALLETYLRIGEGNQQAAEIAIAVARRAALPASEANWRSALDAYLALEQGDLERARAAHITQQELLGDPYRTEAEMDIAVVQASIAAHEEHPAGAEEALRRAGKAVGDVCLCVAANWWEVALVALDAGVDPPLVRELMDSDAPTPIARHAGLIDHMRGALLAAEGRREQAIAAFQRSLDHERRGRRAPLLADAHHRVAEELGAQGQKKRARHHVMMCLELLLRWPGPRRTRAEALQRRLGSGQGPSHDLFTQRELEVVTLVCRGYSNGDIAERLFITRKTASTHLSNILAKTGFQSRTQVAIWAVREGIVADADCM